MRLGAGMLKYIRMCDCVGEFMEICTSVRVCEAMCEFARVVTSDYVHMCDYFMGF